MAAQEVTNEPIRTSRVGKRPVELPKGVTITHKDGKLEVKGPKGTLVRAVPADVVIKIEAAAVTVTSTARGSDAPRLQGMMRAHIANMVKGASEGYTKVLELVGTGYRAEVKGSVVHMALGLSHPVIFPLPGDIKASVPADSKGTMLILTGSDKDLMGQTAATLRGFRPPEPYGGKGVRYKGENVRRKAGKAGKGAGGKKLRRKNHGIATPGT